MSGSRQTALARGRDVELILGRTQHDPVRTGNRIDQKLRRAALAQPTDASGRIVQTGLTLVGEIEIAVAREHEVVHALEALRPARLDERRHLAAVRVEQHDPPLVVGDEDAAIPVNLETVGQPSYSVTSVHIPSGEMRNMRPNGMSVT